MSFLRVKIQNISGKNYYPTGNSSVHNADYLVYAADYLVYAVDYLVHAVDYLVHAVN